jgi:His-Xaa-Ser system radical SAM maturase HxsC
MIALYGRAVSYGALGGIQRNVWRLTTDRKLPAAYRETTAFVCAEGEKPPEDFALVFTRGENASVPYIELPASLDHLGEGDIVAFGDGGARLRVLWRQLGRGNSFLLTERCNNYCLMCSQPPKDTEDGWMLEEAKAAIALLPPSTREIGFTGGEPTIYGQKLLDLLIHCRDSLPSTALHVLSNGRRFEDDSFASAWAGVAHSDLMAGIPLYGPEASLHDYVVQARGAFEQTVRGIVNLARHRQKVEIRFVIHKQTAPALVETCRWIGRNLPFVDKVALMGLEMMGFARANVDAVWIDPFEYRDQLSEAVALLRSQRINVTVYNHQLCTVNRDIWDSCVQSISDWKNEFSDECADCAVRSRCGGFFHSVLLHKVPPSIRRISN